MEELFIELIAIAGFLLFVLWLLFYKDKRGKYHFRLKDLNEDFFLIQLIKVYGQLILFVFIIVIVIFGLPAILGLF
jgi:hypothetical protein